MNKQDMEKLKKELTAYLKERYCFDFHYVPEKMVSDKIAKVR